MIMQHATTFRNPTCTTNRTESVAIHTHVLHHQAIRELSAAVAVAVIKAAAAEGHVRNEGALRRLKQGDARLLHWVQKHMYSPTEYASLAYRPPGVGE